MKASVAVAVRRAAFSAIVTSLVPERFASSCHDPRQCPLTSGARRFASATPTAWPDGTSAPPMWATVAAGVEPLGLAGLVGAGVATGRTGVDFVDGAALDEWQAVSTAAAPSSPSRPRRSTVRSTRPARCEAEPSSGSTAEVWHQPGQPGSHPTAVARCQRVMTRSPHALTNGRYVVGDCHRGTRPVRPGPLLLRPARLAHRPRGARHGDSRRARRLDLHRVPAGE